MRRSHEALLSPLGAAAVVVSIALLAWTGGARSLNTHDGAVLSLRHRSQRDAALVFFGNPGVVHQADYFVPAQASAAAARIGFETVRRHVIDANVQRGWHVDVIFHTWHEQLEAELAGFMAPVAHAAGVRDLLDGRGMSAAIENALSVMRVHVARARNGIAHNRIVLIRYDAVFYTDFLLDKLRDNDALYAASWCKANGNVTRHGDRTCRELIDNENDFSGPRHGIPEFYLAGSPHVLWRMFHGLHLWMLSEPRFPQWAAQYATGANPNTHFIFGERVIERRIRLRRYLQHHMDVDIVRFSDCNGTAVDLPSRTRTEDFGASWLRRYDNDTSETEHSYCGRGEHFCARSDALTVTCPAFDVQP
jgi:hypothetical protein